jgi:hypothetical protein
MARRAVLPQKLVQTAIAMIDRGAPKSKAPTSQSISIAFDSVVEALTTLAVCNKF